jgi:hypothetical protein
MPVWKRRGTKNANTGAVSYCALLADPDRALRDLMHRALVAADYEVIDSSNALQLEVGLRTSAVHDAKIALFVLGARLAAQCSASISAAARERARLALPPVQIILTFEFGTLATLPVPDLAPCVTRCSLEKPFDLLELRAIALECRRLPIAFAARVGAAGSGR